MYMLLKKLYQFTFGPKKSTREHLFFCSLINELPGRLYDCSCDNYKDLNGIFYKTLQYKKFIAFYIFDYGKIYIKSQFNNIWYECEYKCEANSKEVYNCREIFIKNECHNIMTVLSQATSKEYLYNIDLLEGGTKYTLINLELYSSNTLRKLERK